MKTDIKHAINTYITNCVMQLIIDVWKFIAFLKILIFSCNAFRSINSKMFIGSIDVIENERW